MTKHHKMAFLSLLVTFAIALHIIENMLPVLLPVPGAKLGLANIISLLAISLFGLKEGMIINVLRCIMGALLSGSMSSLIYSLFGAVTSTLVMSFFYKYYKGTFSLVGISIIGGISHNLAQITIASLILSTYSLYLYLPFLMVIGLLTGLLTGFTALYARNNIMRIRFKTDD
ncbi:MAG TPA: Gx transporter family protein [Thermoanaerobacterales bacterium]|nr:Gx transporter family protein [Thermoanaerobacterales bacterium]